MASLEQRAVGNIVRIKTTERERYELFVVTVNGNRIQGFPASRYVHLSDERSDTLQIQDQPTDIYRNAISTLEVTDRIDPDEFGTVYVPERLAESATDGIEHEYDVFEQFPDEKVSLADD